MADGAAPDHEQAEREQKKMVDETQKAGGTVYEFDPDATPSQKAATAGKVPILKQLLTPGHAPRPRP
jgi:hypothetical protein